MANLASNVRVGVTGAASHGPLGTKLPTDATTALDPKLKDVGYISEDGVTQSISTDVSDIKAWQNGDVVRKVQTSHDITFQFKMLETTADNQGLYYADPEATAQAVKVTGKQPAHEAWVFDVVDGDRTVRVCISDGQVTDRGEIVWKNSDAISYDVTITAYPDKDGVKAYLYLTPPPTGEAEADTAAPVSDVELPDAA